MVRLIIIEKTGQFWTGVSYGSQSGFNSLTLNSLNDFIPRAEQDLFIAWLKQNINWVLNDFKKRGGVLSSSWLVNNEKAISNDQWESVYIPRYIFGYFLKERVCELLGSAVNKGLLEYKLLKADVTDIQK